MSVWPTKKGANMMNVIQRRGEMFVLFAEVSGIGFRVTILFLLNVRWPSILSLIIIIRRIYISNKQQWAKIRFVEIFLFLFRKRSWSLTFLNLCLHTGRRSIYISNIDLLHHGRFQPLCGHLRAIAPSKSIDFDGI